MFKKDSGSIDMVSLILTVVIPKLVKSYVGTYAAVTMMVGLELDKWNHFLTGIRGGKHGKFYARYYPISTEFIINERFNEHGNGILNDVVLTIRHLKYRIQNLHLCITSSRSVYSFSQRYLSSVSSLVFLERESNSLNLKCIGC